MVLSFDCYPRRFMASSLRLHPPLRFPHHRSATIQPACKPKSYPIVRCGPRDNRGPLYKGRTLSIEAIQAVQSLKRSYRSDPTNNNAVSKTLSRLVKSDLIAAFNELLRQDQLDLALKVFSAIRSEDWYKTDLSLYAKLVSAMAKKGMTDDIDRLISDIEAEDLISVDGKGLVTLIKALIAAERAEPTVRIYDMMKTGGWGCKSAADDYLGKVLSRGLRRLGKQEVADEIDREIGRVSGVILEKTMV